VKHSEDTKDIFKPAVYKIIGRCELAKRSVPTVMPTAEDWMWLQLVLAREIDRSTDPAHEVFTVQDLQKGVIQFGAKHFGNKGSNVGLYFQMLMMSGLFEDVCLSVPIHFGVSDADRALGRSLSLFVPVCRWCSLRDCAYLLWAAKANCQPCKGRHRSL